MTITARVVADSVSEAGKRLTTLQLRYPKFVHGELMTHRAFSRNASSSRAIPVERLIRDVVEDPVYPSFWGKNQAGMQAREECDARVALPRKITRRAAWDAARRGAIDAARAFAAAGYHKQIVNRLVEPFCHINVVVTATEFDNFFALRCHPDAQPEMRELACAMRAAMDASSPKLVRAGAWHLPYVDGDWPAAAEFKNLIKLSVARCARVSYLTQDGNKPSAVEDLALYDRLAAAAPPHASPMEHQATPDRKAGDNFFDFTVNRGYAGGDWLKRDLHGNFVGWCQYRKIVEEKRL